MNKIKKAWQNNKILIVLLSILIICLIAILVVSLTFFLGENKSVYGDRLNDIKNCPVTKKIKSDYISYLENNDDIVDASISVKGKILYIGIEFKEDYELIEAQGKASLSLDKLPKDILKHYDVQFTISSKETENSDGFIMMGAKNVSGSGVVWNNGTKIESEK